MHCYDRKYANWCAHDTQQYHLGVRPYVHLSFRIADTWNILVILHVPSTQLPTNGLEVDLGRPPRLGETTGYNTTVNFATVLSLDKITDGFYQPLALEGSGSFSRQGFFHSCGLTDEDEIVVPTDGPSRIYSVRVWKRCDCCEHRSVGLMVMQEVLTDDGFTEWRECGIRTTAEDAVCEDNVGGEEQFWVRHEDGAAECGT